MSAQPTAVSVVVAAAQLMSLPGKSKPGTPFTLHTGVAGLRPVHSGSDEHGEH